MKFVWRTCIVLSLTGCGAVQTDLPNDSIVSTTLCADTYLLAMPDLEPRLKALSWQSRSSLSRTDTHLQTLPQVDEDPERLLRWKGATIISSAGIEGDINLIWGEDFDTVWKNFAVLSNTLNVVDPSLALQAKLDALPQPATTPRLLYLDRSGATAGTGTFIDAVFRAVGAKNIITTAGWHSPDTENLIGLHPDVIVTSFMGSNYTSVNDKAVRHTALAEKISTTPKINIHGGLWPCAGPGLVKAASQLSQELAKL